MRLVDHFVAAWLGVLLLAPCLLSGCSSTRDDPDNFDLHIAVDQILSGHKPTECSPSRTDAFTSMSEAFDRSIVCPREFISRLPATIHSPTFAQQAQGISFNAAAVVPGAWVFGDVNDGPSRDIRRYAPPVDIAMIAAAARGELTTPTLLSIRGRYGSNPFYWEAWRVASVLHSGSSICHLDTTAALSLRILADCGVPYLGLAGGYESLIATKDYAALERSGRREFRYDKYLLQTNQSTPTVAGELELPEVMLDPAVQLGPDLWCLSYTIRLPGRRHERDGERLILTDFRGILLTARKSETGDGFTAVGVWRLSLGHRLDSAVPAE